jgi:hypothetical protein
VTAHSPAQPLAEISETTLLPPVAASEWRRNWQIVLTAAMGMSMCAIAV